MEYCCHSLQDEIENGYLDKKILIYDATKRCYGIRYSEKPEIYQPIDYCPFCGRKFPNDLNDEYWNTIIKEVGAEYYPTDENYDKNRPLPEEFKTDEWWKKRGL